MAFTSNYIDKSASASPVDLGTKYVSKDYLINTYPDLVSTMKAPALWSWGNAAGGGLGNNSVSGFIEDVSTPIQTTAGGLNWKDFNTAYNDGTIVALKTDGTLWAWGGNYYGEFGNGTATGMYAPSATPVPAFGGGAVWQKVSNSDHTIAMKNDGTIWGSGSNQYGEIGTGVSATQYLTPVQIGTGNDWKLVLTANQFSIGLKNNGTLWGWGSNYYAQLGITGFPVSAENAYCLTPTQIGTGSDWKQVSLANYHTHAVKTNGTLWAWGRGMWGELGNSAPSGTWYSTPVQIGTDTDWNYVSSQDTSCAAIKTNGSLWMWGENTDGELGQNNRTHYSSPVQVGTSTMWKTVIAGHRTTIALKNDGSLWGWGKNHHGQLGVNDMVDRSFPIQIGTYTNWKTIGMGYYIVRAIAEAEGY